MKRLIDGVVIERKGGELTFHLPTWMNIISFEEWKDRNKVIIKKLKR